MKNCLYCQQLFNPPKWARYCSNRCRQRSAYEKRREHYISKAREWALAHPDKKKAAHEKYEKNNPWWVRAGILRRYGLTVDDYNRMLQAQNNKCAACGTENPGSGREYFDVDHCHETGKVRGLLCIGCNRGLGFFADDPVRVMAAFRYLTEWERTDNVEQLNNRVP